MKTRILPAIAFGLIAASCAQMESRAPAPAPAAAPPQEEVLTNAVGMTLYVFDKDVAGSGKSVCNGPCATNWPPQLASKDAIGFGKYTIITRDDGSRQWAYAGRPLYGWGKDQKPGDRTGDNFNNAWHVAKP